MVCSSGRFPCGKLVAVASSTVRWCVLVNRSSRMCMGYAHRQSSEVATSWPNSSMVISSSWSGGGRFSVRSFVYTSRKQLTMSTSYYADRINLYWLMQQHPDWTQQEYALAVNRSKSWVGKWQGRLQQIPKGDVEALHQAA